MNILQDITEEAIQFCQLFCTVHLMKQAGAELGHTRFPSCPLGQCSIQVKSNMVGGYWLGTRLF